MNSNDDDPPWNHSPVWSVHLWLNLGYFIAAGLLFGGCEVHSHEFGIEDQGVAVVCLAILIMGSSLILGLKLRSLRGERPTFAMLTTAHCVSAIPLGFCLLKVVLDFLAGVK